VAHSMGETRDRTLPSNGELHRTKKQRLSSINPESSGLEESETLPHYEARETPPAEKSDGGNPLVGIAGARHGGMRGGPHG
jgi:hypothetical protein